MIFVTVGHIAFDRLIRRMDFIANNVNEKIVMQIGYMPKYLPQNAEYFYFVKRTDMDDYFNRSEVIISHCSISPIISAILFRKPLIMVPRLSLYKEHINDHQVEFARTLEKEKIIGGLFILYDLNILEQTIKEARDTKVTYAPSGGREALIEGIRQFINDI